MNIRIAEEHWRQVEKLTALSFLETVQFCPETGCILLVAENDHSRRPSLLVSDVLAPEDGDLLEQDSGGITFASRFLRRAMLEVRERSLKGFLTLHTHPTSVDSVGFSGFDNANDPELMKNFYEQQPTGIFGSVVKGRNAVCGRVWKNGKPFYLDQLVRVGEGIVFQGLDGMLAKNPPKPEAIFDRSSLLTGAGAMYRLSKLRIAVIGASGTGGLMIELLLRAGVGEIVVFEFDTADETNLNRVLHLRREDVRTGKKKGERAREAAQETGLPTQVTLIPRGDIRDDMVADELRGCDLLIGCVDRDWPRLVLSEMAYQYLIPYLDLGTEIGAAAGTIQSLDARVSYVGPGRPCLLCAGIVREDRIRLEGYEDRERGRVVGLGYSDDLQVAAPAVMDLNMRAASAAMLWVRHLLQPFLVTPMSHSLKESVTNFEMKDIYHQRKAMCHVCGEPARLGSGGRFRITTRLLGKAAD